MPMMMIEGKRLSVWRDGKVYSWTFGSHQSAVAMSRLLMDVAAGKVKP